VACGICHGRDLKGLGNIPGIAGRSPSYIVRQLFDFQTGNRAGVNSALMKPVVENLSMDDMIALASYSASLSPWQILLSEDEARRIAANKLSCRSYCVRQSE
jgi:cytochrome c553